MSLVPISYWNGVEYTINFLSYLVLGLINSVKQVDNKSQRKKRNFKLQVCLIFLKFWTASLLVTKSGEIDWILQESLAVADPLHTVVFTSRSKTNSYSDPDLKLSKPNVCSEGDQLIEIVLISQYWTYLNVTNWNCNILAREGTI